MKDSDANAGASYLLLGIRIDAHSKSEWSLGISVSSKFGTICKTTIIT